MQLSDVFCLEQRVSMDVRILSDAEEAATDEHAATGCVPAYLDSTMKRV